MAGLFQRLKEWVDDETLYSEDLDAEFDNILTVFQSQYVEGSSTVANVPSNARMDAQTAPYPNSQRSYAASVDDELQRLRFMIASITGNTYWYQAPASSLLALYNLLKGQVSVQQNQVTSGQVNSNDGATALVAGGTFVGSQATMQAVTTPLVCSIAGTQYSFNANATISGLSLAPSSNNTALITGPLTNDFSLGEDGSKIPINTVGSNITALIGQFAAFKVVDGGVTEYFTAYVESATALSKAQRGCFYDSTKTPILRVGMNAGDTITLCKLSYIFVTTTGTLDVTYDAPYYSSTQPTSANSGDYWFDSLNQIWKKFNGTLWAAANATFLGVTIQDTANCVAARTYEYAAAWDGTNSIIAFQNGNSQILAEDLGSKISVAGNGFDFKYSLPQWSSGQLASGLSLAASTTYYAYVTDLGAQILDTIKPNDRSNDLKGYYHPFARWRCVGFFATDASKNFLQFTNYGQPSYPKYTGRSDQLVAGLGSVGKSAYLNYAGTGSSPTLAGTVTLKTRGNPVLLCISSDSTGDPVMNLTSSASLTVSIYRNGTNSTGTLVKSMLLVNGSSTFNTQIPNSDVFIDDNALGGDNVYNVYAASDGTHNAHLNGRLFVKELT